MMSHPLTQDAVFASILVYSWAVARRSPSMVGGLTPPRVSAVRSLVGRYLFPELVGCRPNWRLQLAPRFRRPVLCDRSSHRLAASRPSLSQQLQGGRLTAPAPAAPVPGATETRFVRASTKNGQSEREWIGVRPTLPPVRCESFRGALSFRTGAPFPVSVTRGSIEATVAATDSALGVERAIAVDERERFCSRDATFALARVASRSPGRL